jgi:hypothetical protein
MNASKLAFALSTTHNRVLTDEVKAKIDALVEKQTLCKDIFKILVNEGVNISYQNIRGYLKRQQDKENKSK